MITTYQTLELAASSLIDAVEQTDMTGEPEEWRQLLDAVADTCDALGHAGAAHKARHRLAQAAENQGAFWDETGGDPDAAHTDAREVINGLAADLRGLVLAWGDAAEIDDLDDLRACLDTSQKYLAYEVTPGASYESDTFEPDLTESAIDAAVAQVSRALDVIDGIDGTLTELETAARDDAIKKRAGATAMDDLAEAVISAHESGGPVLHVLGAVAGALRAAGRGDAAALLVGRGRAGRGWGVSGDPDLDAVRVECRRLAPRDLHAYRVRYRTPPGDRLLVRRAGGEWCEICHSAETLAALRELPDGAGVDAAWDAL